MSHSLPVVRVLLIAGLLVLGVSGCGRRGALEPPPDPSVAEAQRRQTAEALNEEEAGPVIASPVGTPRPAQAKRGYAIPKEPFILDPLL